MIGPSLFGKLKINYKLTITNYEKAITNYEWTITTV